MAYYDWHFGLHAVVINLFCYARETILFLLIFPLANVQSLSFDYHDFSQADLKLEGNASFSDSVIRLTAKVDQTIDWDGSVGRVMYPKPLLLWNKSSNKLQDFTTKFSFVVFSNQVPYADGLAFFLASPNLPNVNDTPELGGAGLGIGLVDVNQTLLPLSYQFVAVEFDTYSNNWDPDGEHVGVNINSMRSEIIKKWSTYMPERKVYDCSIEYNSKKYSLDVTFTGYRSHGLSVKQYTRLLSYHVDLREHLPESVIVGISAATGGYVEEHNLLSWSFSTTLPRNGNGRKLRYIKLLEGIGIGIGLSVILLGLCNILLLKMKKREKEEQEPTSNTISDKNMDDEFYMDSGAKKIDYCELVTATNNFEETQKLGQGDFGVVYKGHWKDSNSYAAIKRRSADSRQGIEEYRAEVKISSQLRHRNLVKLTGWCHENNDLMLIYEYMPNGSLDSHLFGGQSILSWNVRYNVAMGLASALLYLQEQWEKCVLHNDINSSNIMLDCDFNPKLGDFGLARLVDHEKGSQTTEMAGTSGYLAPEYMATGKATKESDIFSYGIVMLELASGRKALHHHHHHKDSEGKVSLVEWVWELYGSRNLLAASDPNLLGVFDMQQMECLLVVGIWCANPDYQSRPSIRQVIKVLSFEAPLPILPQKMPALAYTIPTTDEFFFSVSSSSP